MFIDSIQLAWLVGLPVSWVPGPTLPVTALIRTWVLSVLNSGVARYDLHHSMSSGMMADMIIGDRLRALREEKELSQGDIEKRTGLIRAYISRVENNHTVPSIGTLEKMARALEVPLYAIFYDGEEPPVVAKLLARRSAGKIEWGDSRKGSLFLRNFRSVLGLVNDDERSLLLFMANKMALRSISRARRAK